MSGKLTPLEAYAQACRMQRPIDEVVDSDYEYYRSTVPVHRQIPKDNYMQLPRGRHVKEQRERWHEELIDRQGVINSNEFPNPRVTYLHQFSYTSKCYDYPRK